VYNAREFNRLWYPPYIVSNADRYQREASGWRFFLIRPIVLSTLKSAILGLGLSQPGLGKRVGCLCGWGCSNAGFISHLQSLSPPVARTPLDHTASKVQLQDLVQAYSSSRGTEGFLREGLSTCLSGSLIPSSTSVLDMSCGLKPGFREREGHWPGLSPIPSCSDLE
jgi:hypothetical protein